MSLRRKSDGSLLKELGGGLFFVPESSAEPAHYVLVEKAKEPRMRPYATMQIARAIRRLSYAITPGTDPSWVRTYLIDAKRLIDDALAALEDKG